VVNVAASEALKSIILQNKCFWSFLP